MTWTRPEMFDDLPHAEERKKQTNKKLTTKIKYKCITRVIPKTAMYLMKRNKSWH